MSRFPEPDPGTPRLDSARGYLLWVAGAYRASVVLSVLNGVICTLAQALIPAAIGRGIDAGLLARDQQALVRWSAAVLGLGVIQAISGMLRDRWSLTNRFGTAYRTVQLVTRQAARLGAELPHRVSAGSVVSVGATDVTRIGAALESTARGGGAVVSIAVVAALMLGASWQLGLLALAGVPLIAWAVAGLMRRLHARQRGLREEQGALADLAVDIIDGLRVLRGIGGEAVFSARYRERSQRVRREAVRLGAAEANVAAARILLPGLLVTAIVWLGAHLVGTGQLRPGALVAFYGYAVFLAEQLRRATTMVDQLTRGLVGAGHVVSFLSLTRELPTGTQRPAAADSGGTLHDPDAGLTVPAGRLVGVACADPADAHHLADRLGRYTASRARYADVPLTEMPLDEVRRRILLVDHQARLFSGTLVRELAPFDLPGDAQRLSQALDIACARDIVDALPGGPDQEITGDREFSGGQRQRLALVRALVADPETLILVEPTSALDAHTEGRVASRLAAHRAGRTTVVFTTSPLVLDHTDHVVYVENGRAAAEGSHRSLLRDARYRAVVTREVATA
ncbi:ABC transporter transmembrane domain-containing protein [Streptomyces sp. NPDC001852]|uniref:ABC transporter transmembrane domain-containing protein n=1 Tax=Streptomyces sp. NPDC001852 TaxID=3364619 RepID=UPI00369328C9